MPEISREDAIWLAGLLEGEGTFDLHRKKYPRVRVGMSDRDVVGRAATLTGRPGPAVAEAVPQRGHVPRGGIRDEGRSGHGGSAPAHGRPSLRQDRHGPRLGAARHGRFRRPGPEDLAAPGHAHAGLTHHARALPQLV